jgi:hypothetical protein
MQAIQSIDTSIARQRSFICNIRSQFPFRYMTNTSLQTQW